MAVPPSGMVTLLFTDIEGSTRLWESQPDEMHDALQRHDAVVRSAVEAAGGYVFKTVGDAFCVAFATAASGLAGAVAAQHALSREHWHENVTIKARMALHSGKCNERDGDYFGPTVNRTARLEAIGHGGQLLLSGAAVALLGVDRTDGVDLRDMGEHRLKDLAGAERVFQAVISGLPNEFPPLRSLGNVDFHHNLPRYATSFVGREAVLREVQDLIEGGRVITLVGAGGSGKTRLAVQVAAEMLDAAGDGVWLVELAPVTEPAEVAASIASVLGIEAAAGRTFDDTLLDALASRRLLLVLDNCEHVIDAVADFADAVMMSCPHVALLATSREPLDVDGEHVVRLPTLRSPAAGVDLAAIEASEAVCLFVERAQTHRRDFELTAENADAVASVCRRLDGLPLAIELAAASVRMFSVAEIADRLDQRFVLLSGGGRRPAVERHQTLRSVIDWSYELLDHAATTSLRVNLRVQGRVDVEGGRGRVREPRRRERLSRSRSTCALVDKSLVEAIPLDSGATRYDMLETIRAYAAETLAASGDAVVDATRTAHLRYFVALGRDGCTSAARERPGRVVRQARRRRREPARSPRLRRHAEPDSALRLVVALNHYWRRRSHTATVIANVRAVVAGASTAPPSRYADGLFVLARLESMLGDLEASVDCVERVFAVVQQSGDQTRLAYALSEKAWMCCLRGDDAEATRCADAALQLAHDIADEALLAACEHIAGNAKSRTSDAATCLRHHEASLGYFERMGDECGSAFALINIAALELERPDPDFERATTYSRRAFEIFERQKEPFGAAEALDNVAGILADQGHAAEALALFGEVLSRAHHHGDIRLVAFTLVRMAPVLADSAAAPAAQVLGHADALLERLGLALGLRERHARAAAERHCQAALGRDAYLARREIGARLPTREAVEAVLDLAERAPRTRPSAPALFTEWAARGSNPEPAD